MPEQLAHWVIYFGVTDQPVGKYVVRRWTVGSGGKLFADLNCQLAESLAGARNLVPRGLTCMPRDPSDDVGIMEVWL